MYRNKSALRTITKARNSRILCFVYKLAINVSYIDGKKLLGRAWDQAGDYLREESMLSPVMPEVIKTADQEDNQASETDDVLTPNTSNSTSTIIQGLRSSPGNDDSGDDSSIDEDDSASDTSEDPSSAETQSDLNWSESVKSGLSEGAEGSVESDFSEEVGGQFWNTETRSWNCEKCGLALQDGVCLECPETGICQDCGWTLEDDSCLKCTTSYDCRGSDAEATDEDFIIFDPADDIWRYVRCCWEIEATNNSGGYCFCLNEEKEHHYHGLSACPDYKPGELCDTDEESEDSQSEDSEPESADERFIDDEESDMTNSIFFDTVAETNIIDRIIAHDHHEWKPGAMENRGSTEAVSEPGSKTQQEITAGDMVPSDTTEGTSPSKAVSGIGPNLPLEQTVDDRMEIES